jgi:hypothetical protein
VLTPHSRDWRVHHNGPRFARAMTAEAGMVDAITTIVTACATAPLGPSAENIMIAAMAPNIGTIAATTSGSAVRGPARCG